MPSFNESAALLRAVHEDAIDEGRKEALNTAISTVDSLLAHSSTLAEFQGKWNMAKALYEEHTEA